MVAPMVKAIILLNFAFTCRLVNETCTITLMQANKQANQLARVIDCIGNITNFTENCSSKSLFFFSRLKRDLFFNFCVCIKKVHQENIPFMKAIHVYIFSLKA